MRTVLKSIIIASVLCFASNTVSAQTLKDMLKLESEDILKTAAAGAASTQIEKKLD